jgi:hypothetical protein
MYRAPSCFEVVNLIENSARTIGVILRCGHKTAMFVINIFVIMAKLIL